ncbi:Phage terminase large subunit [compost metagenome]
MATARIELPAKLIPVFSGEADVRGAYGGRGSGKTRSFAKMSAVRAYMWAMAGREGIILCARQYMNSLDDSSLEEIKAAIRSEPWLAAFFEIGDKYVKTKDGRVSYKFAGLDRSIDSIKSKARILLCWVDEAEPVTDVAWLTLIPTLREEDSELWVTWNPKRKGSPTDLRFRKAKDPRFKVIQLNWRDNPRFPAKLERDRQRDAAERPDEYDHVWEGAYGNIAGSILGKWVGQAEREGRVSDGIVFDPDGAPIEVSSDLGFRDTASWWYWQRLPGGFNLLKYEGESGLDADDWIPKIQESVLDLGAPKVGKIWLPHDARAKTFQSKHTTIEKFLSAFGSGRVAVVPQTRKSDQISAARAVLPRCAFNKDLCEAGLDGLRAWEFEYNDDTGVFSREPLHNWASHPSDAFAYGAQVMAEAKAPEKEEDAKYPVKGVGGRIVTATLDELWAQTPARVERI